MPFLSTHIFKKFCSFLRFLIYLHRFVEIWVFSPLLREKPPQSLRDSSPKGTPYGATAKFPATAKAVPLGKVASPQAMTEGVVSGVAKFPAKVQSLRVCQRLPPRGSWQSRKVLTEGVKHPLSHTKSTASLCGKRCFFQPFSARLWKTRCSFSSSYWWGP